MRRVFLLLFCLGSLPALAQQGAPRPGAPSGTPPAAPQAQAVQDRAANVINRAAAAITTLYVSSTEEDNWGTNRLGGQPLAAGRSFQVRLGQGRHCRFDLQVVYSDGKVEERRDQDVCRNRQVIFDGSKAAMPVDRTERKVTLLNRAPRTIKQVFLSPKSASNWGDDVLVGTIAPGEDSELTYRGECIVDVRVVFDNASAEERREADLCNQATVVIAPGWTTTDEIPATEADLPRVGAATPGGGAPAGGVGTEMTVVNITGKTVEELYVFPDGVAEEGPDRLGNDTLDDGANHRFRLDRRGACNFTIRGVMANNAGELRIRSLDLCASTEIRLDGSMVVASGAQSTPGTLTPGIPAPALPAAPQPRATPATPTSPPPAGVTRLRNVANVPAVAVFADPEGSPRGDDRLGERTLRPGQTFDLAPPVAGQCRYHLVVIYRDGRNADVSADLCATRELALP